MTLERTGAGAMEVVRVEETWPRAGAFATACRVGADLAVRSAGIVAGMERGTTVAAPWLVLTTVEAPPARRMATVAPAVSDLAAVAPEAA